MSDRPTPDPEQPEWVSGLPSTEYLKAAIGTMESETFALMKAAVESQLAATEKAIAERDTAKEEAALVHEMLYGCDFDAGDTPTIERARRAKETIATFEHGVREVCLALEFDPADGEESISEILRNAKERIKERVKEIARLDLCARANREECTALKIELETVLAQSAASNEAVLNAAAADRIAREAVIALLLLVIEKLICAVPISAAEGDAIRSEIKNGIIDIMERHL